MTSEELDRLWDPGAPVAGAEAIVALLNPIIEAGIRIRSSGQTHLPR